jgi:hypothetical protein
MGDNASDFLVQRLYDWGIRRIYGYPGDGINGVFGALDRHSDKIEFIQARHEEEAAFMATAHAKLTGEVGVCIATSGPGAIHLLNGLYDAKKGFGAGDGHRRPVGLDLHGQRLPAGGRSDLAVQGCGRPLRPHGRLGFQLPPPGRPQPADRQGRAGGHLHHPAPRPAGNGFRRSSRASTGPFSPASAIRNPR